MFLSNNFTLAASTITRLYRRRWQVELFFKWIKQNLRIEAFLGNSNERGQDSVVDRHKCLRAHRHRAQELDVSQSMAEMVQILSLTLFEKTLLLQVFADAKMTNRQIDDANPWPLFDF